MLLKINSTQNTLLTLFLDEKRKEVHFDSPRNQDILREIDVFLEEEGRTLQDLTAVEVETGPGQFTSLRVGVTIASTLSFALNIPINGKPPGTTPEIEYGKPPGITISKK